MAQVVYTLCAITSLVCALMLIRAYRGNRVPLLRWSALCFVGLTVTNVLLFLDRLIVPGIDLTPLRNFITLLSLGALLYGLIYEAS